MVKNRTDKNVDMTLVMIKSTYKPNLAGIIDISNKTIKIKLV